MSESRQVRAPISAKLDDRVDLETVQRLRRYGDRDAADVARRLRALDREWEIDRLLQLNAAIIGITGLVLGTARRRRWFALPGIAFSFLALNALQGWCPPALVMRRLGMRTRPEIDREKYALKAMRGDFQGAVGRSQAAWRAVRE